MPLLYGWWIPVLFCESHLWTNSLCVPLLMNYGVYLLCCNELSLLSHFCCSVFLSGLWRQRILCHLSDFQVLHFSKVAAVYLFNKIRLHVEETKRAHCLLLGMYISHNDGMCILFHSTCCCAISLLSIDTITWRVLFFIFTVFSYSFLFPVCAGVTGQSSHLTHFILHSDD